MRGQHTACREPQSSSSCIPECPDTGMPPIGIAAHSLRICAVMHATRWAYPVKTVEVQDPTFQPNAVQVRGWGRAGPILPTRHCAGA